MMNNVCVITAVYTNTPYAAVSFLLFPVMSIFSGSLLFSDRSSFFHTAVNGTVCVCVCVCVHTCVVYVLESLSPMPTAGESFCLFAPNLVGTLEKLGWLGVCK